ncbi:DUF6777 domain-containing protein [Streptomyces sp. NPDC060028]|uniref:DUF6777 domain-containing protein n=1 Tax=Streptomyces sp. NPDC060028 TaxID=3347041 RepID=UPI00368D225F
MTTQPSGQQPPPSPERPTGPPSGPLSGGQQGPPPPPPPPPAPPGSGGGGPGGTPAGTPPKGPWWRSVPGLVTALVAVAAAVVLAVVLTRPSGTSTSADGEVFLQPAVASGPDPFTESTAAEQATPPPEPPQSPPPSTSPTGTRSISGSSPGLYGGTRHLASCDVEKQVRVLTAQPAKNTAFASALGIRPASVPAYLRSLTPVQLRMDTRVTNHGYRDGKATSYQAVLQAGTAVLVDDRGVPRVRCACGNPLAPPVALKANPKRFGQVWNSYRPTQVVVIAPSVTVVDKFVIYDHHDRTWYERDRGDHQGKHDKPAPPPPVIPSPPLPPSPSDSGSSSPSESASSPPLRPVAPSSPPVSSSSPSSPASPSDESSAPSSAAPEPPPQSSSSSSSSPPPAPRAVTDATPVAEPSP